MRWLPPVSTRLAVVGSLSQVSELEPLVLMSMVAQLTLCIGQKAPGGSQLVLRACKRPFRSTELLAKVAAERLQLLHRQH